MFNVNGVNQPVAPLTGAWIETNYHALAHGRANVAPLTGAWIETPMSSVCAGSKLVAPLTGAWIETNVNSHLPKIATGRAPHGRVD